MARGKQDLASRFQGTQVDFDRELTAILAQPVQIHYRSHRRRLGRVGISCPVRAMSSAIALGHQHFHLLSQNVLSIMAEERFRARIRQHDSAFSVHDHHGVRSRFQEIPESLFGAAGLGYIFIGNENRRVAAILQFSQHPTAGYHQPASVSPAVIHFAFPIATRHEFRFHFRKGNGEPRVEQFFFDLPHGLLRGPTIEFLRASIPIPDRPGKVAHYDGVIRQDPSARPDRGSELRFPAEPPRCCAVPESLVRAPI